MTSLLSLFWSFFQVGLFSIGGGYAALGVIEQQAVEIHGWISASEYLDLITIAEMTPGPITLNSATFVGLRVAGLGGALVATFACILPAIIIVSVLAYVYFKYKQLALVQGVLAGLRPAVVAIVASAGVSIVTHALFGDISLFEIVNSKFMFNIGAIDIIAIVLFVVAIIVLAKFKTNPVFVIMACGVLGGAVYILKDYLLISV